VKVRYKQTAFGAAWAVGQPLLMMAIFSVFLGRLARIPSDGVPYPVFAFAGLLPWLLFAQVLQGASESLVRSSDLITKIYFPRLFLPVSVAVSFVMDYAISLVILGFLILAFHLRISGSVVWLPLLSAFAVVTALAVGIWLSALNVRFRDVRHAVPFLIQVWLFMTPVVYPATLVPERWRAVYALNPMVGVVDGIRWSAFGEGQPPGILLGISVVAMLVILVGGLVFFHKVERSFADVI
jgi:lipopolysaccharide transport system permease protein